MLRQPNESNSSMHSHSKQVQIATTLQTQVQGLVLGKTTDHMKKMIISPDIGWAQKIKSCKIFNPKIRRGPDNTQAEYLPLKPLNSKSSTTKKAQARQTKSLKICLITTRPQHSQIKICSITISTQWQFSASTNQSMKTGLSWQDTKRLLKSPRRALQETESRGWLLLTLQS